MYPNQGYTASKDDELVKTLLSKVVSYELFMFLLLFYHNPKRTLSVQLFEIGNMYLFESLRVI